MIKIKQHKLNTQLTALFQQQFRMDPPAHIESILKRSTASFDSSKLGVEDIPYLKLILSLKLSQITIQCSHHPIDQQLIPLIIKKVKYSESGLYELGILNCKFLNEFCRQISVAFARCRTLKKIRLVNCNIDDEFLGKVMYPLETNNNLRSLDFSENHIRTCGPIITALEEHNIYRCERIEMERLDCDQEIMELNLQNNEIEDKEAIGLGEYMKGNRWVRVINLSGNRISKEGLERFILEIEENKSLLNMDLRNNTGSTIEISNLIFNKTLKNMAEFKSKRSKNTRRENNSADFGYKKPNSRNMTMNHDHQIEDHLSCHNCKKLCAKILQTQKKVIDLQLEIRKLKTILQNRGFEISVINPSSHQHTQEISFSAKNMGCDSSSDDIVQKIENMMADLTKILQGHQIHQNTQIDITNPLWTTHNLSNTVQILAPNQNSIAVPLPEQEDQLSDIES